MPDPGPEEFSRVVFTIADLLESLGAPILQKLKAQREYDFTDAVSVVEEQRGGLDSKYLDLWARRLGVEQELAEVMEGGLGG